MLYKRAFVLLLGILLAGTAVADRTTRLLKKVEGYVVYAVTSVDGEFNGCDFNKVIKLQDGTAFKCSTFAYTYAYSPDAVVFVKVTELQGRKLAQVKLLVENELMDMEPVLFK
jgi:hypothetical protein